jgi:hypothetical protein
MGIPASGTPLFIFFSPLSMELQRSCTSFHVPLEMFYGPSVLETCGTCPEEGITAVNPDVSLNIFARVAP